MNSIPTYTRMVETVINYKQLSPNLATGGQPDRDQLSQLAETGYEVVINLGLEDAEYAIPNEQAILEAQGIRYIHIPVKFEAPAIAQYREFSKILKALLPKKVFIHCAANKRVSVFMALFRILDQNIPHEQAMAELTSCWQPDATWHGFITRVLSEAGTAPE
ncbi:MAG: protein tyrosine phosphatase family protein [Gammaproteobacteria bacterium]|jgi:protein tyrosine phosphatase (PTP) superfamily phosphohydrolase (DUF442 family)